MSTYAGKWSKASISLHVVPEPWKIYLQHRQLWNSIYYVPLTKQGMFGGNHYKRKPYYQVLQTGAGTKVMVHGNQNGPQLVRRTTCVMNWYTAGVCANAAKLASNARPYVVVKAIVTKNDSKCVDLIVMCTPIHDTYVMLLVLHVYSIKSILLLTVEIKIL